MEYTPPPKINNQDRLHSIFLSIHDSRDVHKKSQSGSFSIKNIFFSTLILLMSGALIASAALAPLTPPPIGGYDVGANNILDPGCTPGTTDCFVKSSYSLPSAGSAGQVLTFVSPGVYSWNTSSSGGWSLAGNSGTTATTNFIGTTDAQDVVVKTNSIERVRVLSTLNTNNQIMTVTGGDMLINDIVVGRGQGNDIFNTATGNGALAVNTVSGGNNGKYNSAFGYFALNANTTGFLNSAFGYKSLQVNTIGRANTGFGAETLRSNTTGLKNTAIGNASMYNTTTGSNNTAMGSEALYNNTTGSNNVAIGLQAHDTSGAFVTASNDVAVGAQSLYNNTSGGGNTAIGFQAGFGVISGSNNTFLGKGAGIGLVTGANNTIIGANMASLSATSALSNNILLADGSGNLRLRTDDTGKTIIGSGISASTTIGNTFEITHGTAGNSGLRFTNLTSTTVPGSTASKFLTVDTNGNVVLLNTSGGLSPQWYAENTAAPITAPSATGAGSIAIGNGASGTAVSMIVLGNSAGNSATGASSSNFIGASAGSNATNASNSNFIGIFAGQGASGASNSNFIGDSAGAGAANASRSNLFGYQVGSAFTGNNIGSNNIIIGTNISLPNGAGSSMNIGGVLFGTGFYNTTAGNPSITPIAGGRIGIGNVAPGNKLEITHGTAGNSGLRFTDLLSTSMAGASSGKVLSVNATGDVVLETATSGSSPAWYSENATAPVIAPVATGAGSIAIGNAARGLATSMIAIGSSAGNGATSANQSNFIGASAGSTAANASGSNFMGVNAGNGATDAFQSNFTGSSAGLNATNASQSNFIGSNAGNGATNASLSNLFGTNVGQAFTGNNIGSNNIIIGTNISLPNAAANSMNIGGVLFGTGFHSNTGTNPSITPITGGRIGIGNVTPSYLLHVGSSAVTSGTSVARFENAGGTCTVTPNTAGGITCTSDIRFKKDITDVSNTDTLSKLISLDIKSYRMTADSDNTEKQIGFIAQNVETVFPHLVMTDTDGRKAVSYAGFAPVIVSAIKELSTKVDMAVLNTGNTNSSGFFDSLRSWLGNATNGLEKVFAKRIETNEFCITDESGTDCYNRNQLKQMIVGGTSGSGSGSTNTGNDTLSASDITSGSDSNSTDTIGDIAGGSAGTDATDTTEVGTTTDETSVSPTSDDTGTSEPSETSVE